MDLDDWIAALTRYLGEWPERAKGYFVSTWGLQPDFALKAATLYAALWMAGLNPRITSGLRDPAKQAAMRAAWDRGDRQGLRARPAKSSTHTEGIGIDIVSSNEQLAADIAQALGLRAGYYFKTPDPGHYDMRGVV